MVAPGRENIRSAYEEERLSPTVVNVVFARWPIVVIATKQTTMMTAYSTAVGPSSRLRNSTTARAT